MSHGPQQPSPPSPQGDSGGQPTTQSPPAKANQIARLPWIIAWGVSVVLAFVLGTQSTGLLGRSHAPTSQATPTSATTTPGAQPQGAQSVAPEVADLLKSLPRRDPNDATAQGRPNAKVVLIEWSDYRCPFCATWHVQTRPALQKYIDNGTLRIEFRDLPLFGEQSQQTAVAARAAARQGKFWEYQQAVFAAAPKSGHPDIPRAKTIEFARQVGLPDIARFEADLADARIQEAIDADAQQARELGISGTPFFVINTGFINGARPTADFIHAVESAAQQ